MNGKDLYFEHKSELQNVHGYHIDYRRSVYKKYEKLTAEDIDEFIDMVIAEPINIDDNNDPDDDKIDLILHLALFSYACGDTLPERLYDYLLENEIYYYTEIYFRANESVAQRLIERGAEKKDIDRLWLIALAAIPSPIVKEFFLKNKNNPRWTEKYPYFVTVPQDLGWEIDERGEVRKLYSDDITAFERCDKATPSDLFPLKALDEECQFCHQPLTLVFDGKQKLATCLYCHAWQQTLFIKQIGNQVFWHEKNELSKFFRENPDRLKNVKEFTAEYFARIKYGLKPSGEQRKATYTANQFVEIFRTQIGGLPTEITQISYPQCPECGRTMKFAAQLSWKDIEEWGEGITYFFTCEQCQVHASNYDQT